ncbi:TPA: hypothetical protein ACY3HI_001172 [Citrobacter braakii]
MNTKANSVLDQIIGISVDHFNEARMADLALQQELQERSFALATEQMQNIRDFVANPDRILGSMPTKHGEIAEQVEVGIRNARQAISEQLQSEDLFSATFNGVGRTAPEDYLINGIEVQSKFINGINNNLDHVLKHLDKYPDFSQNKAYYHIPKDSWAVIKNVMDGKHVDGLSDKTIQSIIGKVKLLEEQTHRSFDDLIRPGISDYSEVQLGRIDSTLDIHEEELFEKNNKQNEKIISEHAPSLNEAMKSAATGAAIAGAASLGYNIYKKYKSGKNIFKGEFSSEDWGELGVDSLKAGVVGGISAGGIYTLTNFASMSAPLAGAFVTAVKGVSSLSQSYFHGDIDDDKFTDLSLIICAESAIVGIMAVSGQALIPIPVLGALIGSVSGKFLSGIAKSLDKKITNKLNEKMDSFTRDLNRIECHLLKNILDEFDALGQLTLAAFDFEKNKMLLNSSAKLAQAYGVLDSAIIKNHAELDFFMDQ